MSPLARCLCRCQGGPAACAGHRLVPAGPAVRPSAAQCPGAHQCASAPEEAAQEGGTSPRRPETEQEGRTQTTPHHHRRTCAALLFLIFFASCARFKLYESANLTNSHPNSRPSALRGVTLARSCPDRSERANTGGSVLVSINVESG